MNWRNRGARHDPVWIQAGGDNQYGDMGGKKIGFVECFCNIRMPITGETFSVVITVLHETLNGGRLTGPERLIQIRRTGGTWAIFSLRDIVGLVHLIEYGDDRWVVNSRIDLRTFNTIPV